MLLIPGILASRFTPQGDFESIATVTVGSGGVADISFTSIPSTYQHLQIRYIARDTSTGQYFTIQVNGDTSVNSYTWHSLQGDGSSATAASSATGTFPGAVVNFAAGSTTDIFSAHVIDILDYANTNKYTTFRSLGGYDANGSGVVNLQSNVWTNSNAVTSLKFLYNTGNIAQYSHFALYGIKG
jgi:hypothetical protein